MTAATDDDRFVTAKELADFLNAPSKAGDTDVIEALDAALEWVTDRVGPLTRGGAVERVYDVYPSGHSLVIPDTHLQGVGTITDPDGAVVEVPASRINLLAGVITVRTRGRLADGIWKVHATPRDANTSMALAVKIIASHLYEVHRGRAGEARTRAGFEGITNPVGDPVVPKGFAIPNRAAQLLEPFLRGK